jgi:hypothetical protein
MVLVVVVANYRIDYGKDLKIDTLNVYIDDSGKAENKASLKDGLMQSGLCQICKDERLNPSENALDIGYWNSIKRSLNRSWRFPEISKIRPW